MSDHRNNRVVPWQRLIEQESQAALERFRRRDFRAAMERRLQAGLPLRRRPWFRRPLPMAIGLAAALALALGIGAFTSFLAMKREVRELREILMRLPELRTPLAALSPAPASEEEARRIQLSWIFRLAGERLTPGPATEAEWRSMLERALASPPVQEAGRHPLRRLSDTELRRLEKRIRALIAASELQRLREQNIAKQL